LFDSTHVENMLQGDIDQAGAGAKIDRASGGQHEDGYWRIRGRAISNARWTRDSASCSCSASEGMMRKTSLILLGVAAGANL
jgi:hypothetical protein